MTQFLRLQTKQERRSQLASKERQLAVASGYVKLMTGVGNNAAITVMMHAYNVVAGIGDDEKGRPRQAHPNFRHECKRAYQDALREYEAYESRLLHASTKRFFHLADLDEKHRKVYGDITDREYFDFWRGLGAKPYTDTLPFIRALHNKYRLSLVNHHVPYAEILAWPMAATACLTLAVEMYDMAIRAMERAGISRKVGEAIFGKFSLRPLLTRWTRAMFLTEPKSEYELDPTEDRNIEIGIRQILDVWSDPETIYGAVIETVPEYEEIFRTKGEMKKALRTIASVKADTIAEMETMTD